MGNLEPLPKYSKAQLEALQKEWTKKLKDSGFRDLECIDSKEKVLITASEKDESTKRRKKDAKTRVRILFAHNKPDWVNYNHCRKEFGRRRDEYGEFFWVIELNAYHNPEVKEPNRTILRKYCELVGTGPAFTKYVKTFNARMELYYYIDKNLKKFVTFATKFKEEEDLYRLNVIQLKGIPDVK